jgi:hypothetical protein
MRTDRQSSIALRVTSAFHEAGRWLLECIESFPIPIEEALWVHAYGYPDVVKGVSAPRTKRVPKFQEFQADRRHASNSH